MAYIDDEINKKARDNFYSFFYTSFYNQNPLGVDYVPAGTTVPDINEFLVSDFIIKEETEQEIKIQICVQRPGILIGHHGNVITGLSKFMSEQMGKKVAFYIFESTMWNKRESATNNKILETELRY